MRTASSTISGATQTPLLDAAQLVPGTIVSGIAFNHVWEVVELQGDDVLLRKMTLHQHLPCPTPVGHTFRPLSGSFRVCTCEHGLERIAALLPSRADTVKTLVIQPSGPLVVPDVFTVYITQQLDTLRVMSATWGTDMPIFPKVWPLWTVPEELRDLIRGQLERPSNAAATPRRA